MTLGNYAIVEGGQSLFFLIQYFRGVAQLVARVLWEHDAAGSSPVTPTISSVHNRFKLWTLDIFLLMLTFRLNIELF